MLALVVEVALSILKVYFLNIDKLHWTCNTNTTLNITQKNEKYQRLDAATAYKRHTTAIFIWKPYNVPNSGILYKQPPRSWSSSEHLWKNFPQKQKYKVIYCTASCEITTRWFCQLKRHSTMREWIDHEFAQARITFVSFVSYGSSTLFVTILVRFPFATITSCRQIYVKIGINLIR